MLNILEIGSTVCSFGSVQINRFSTLEVCVETLSDVTCGVQWSCTAAQRAVRLSSSLGIQCLSRSLLEDTNQR